jgi:5'-3' exonuclease
MFTNTQHNGVTVVRPTMGVNGLFPDILKNYKARHQVRLSHFKGKRLGIDVSAWIHPLCKRETAAMSMQSIPAYPPTQLIDEIKRRVEILRQEDITPVFVFDGHRHPMKDVARIVRNAKLEKATKRQDLLLAKANNGENMSEAEREQFKKNWSDMNVPTNSLIATIANWLNENEIEYKCAPFEAEWQLVYLEMIGEIHGMITQDSDVLVLGAKVALLDVKFHDEASKRNCAFFEFSEVFEREGPLVHWKDHMPELAAFLGCDFCERVKKNGPVTILSLVLPSYILLKDDASRFSFLKQHGGSPEYAINFLQTTGLFRHAPVLDNQGKLVPLRAMSEMDTNQWSSTIGFDPFRCLLPLTTDKFEDAAVFRLTSFHTGAILKSFETEAPTYTNTENSTVEAGTKLPHFARLDFEAMPISLVPTLMLVSWCKARRIFFAGRDSRRYIEKRINDQLRIGNRLVLPPALVPTGLSWSGFSAIAPTSPWEGEYYPELKKLAAMHREDVDGLVANENSEVRRRALLHWKAGSYLVIDTMQFCYGKSKIDDSDIVLFKCRCVPSMKSEIVSENEDGTKKSDSYLVYLAFAKNGKLLDCPHSECGCPRGLTFCSHLMGFTIACYVAQYHATSQEHFEENLPPSPIHLQNQPLLIENMTRKDPHNRIHGQQKKHLNRTVLQDITNA